MLPALRRKLSEHRLEAFMDRHTAGDRPAMALVRQGQHPPPAILGIRCPGEQPLTDEPVDDLRSDRKGQVELAGQGGHPVGASESDFPEYPELRGQEPRGAAGPSQQRRVARQAATERFDQEFLRIPATAVGFQALSRHRMSQGPIAN